MLKIYLESRRINHSNKEEKKKEVFIVSRLSKIYAAERPKINIQGDLKKMVKTVGRREVLKMTKISYNILSVKLPYGIISLRSDKVAQFGRIVSFFGTKTR